MTHLELNSKIKWILIYLLLGACVAKVDFDVPLAQSQIVIEGIISDSPGPYTVYVSKALSLNSDSSYRDAIEKVKIKLMDDLGNSENLIEVNSGVYKTGGVIQGEVGHSYHIILETLDGKKFESEPDMLKAVGALTDIRFTYEARRSKTAFTEIDADVFNIYIDGDSPAGDDNYTRWRFKGTYKIVTFPDLNYTKTPPYAPYKNPYPCSGFRIGEGPIGSGGILIRFGECTCCTCWANQFEEMPQLSDIQLASNNQFKNIKVAEVRITNNFFADKYLVEVEQMSLSRMAFDYFKLIRKQKEGASSIFQPPAGKIVGNIKALNSNVSVVGLFWATSIKSKYIFINRSNVPYPLTPPEYSTMPCNRVKYSSNVKPILW